MKKSPTSSRMIPVEEIKPGMLVNIFDKWRWVGRAAVHGDWVHYMADGQRYATRVGKTIEVGDQSGGEGGPTPGGNPRKDR